MGTKWSVDIYENLYDVWKPKIAEKLNKISDQSVINLASNEYWKAVDTDIINTPVITPQFKEFKDGKYRIVAIYAKKARGLMARYAIKNKIMDPEELKKFNLEGYSFNQSISTDDEWVFIRI